MKKIIYSIVVMMVSLSANAQVVKLYKGDTLVKEYSQSEVDNVVFAENGQTESDANLLAGTFSVSATKKVQFTKANLCWNGSEYAFEDTQVAFADSWNANHVSLFYWSNSRDYMTPDKQPYQEQYSYYSERTSDNFFASITNTITVAGTSDLYVLTKDEWNYLLNERKNYDNLWSYATIGDTPNCLLIAPDDFTGVLRSYYTLDEMKSLGIVCLPSAGRRSGTHFYETDCGFYQADCAYSSESSYSWYLYFSGTKKQLDYASRGVAKSVRLVKTTE